MMIVRVEVFFGGRQICVAVGSRDVQTVMVSRSGVHSNASPVTHKPSKYDPMESRETPWTFTDESKIQSELSDIRWTRHRSASYRYCESRRKNTS